jgi:tetratricopeptide (TPR) repeat protein
MKNKFLTFLGVVLFSSQLMAQKANETSAAMEYKKYSDAITIIMLSGDGDMDIAKKSIEKAKNFIDLAATNETTKESPKTLFYKGEIYTGYLIAFATDSVFMKSNAETYFNTGIESYQKSLSISTKFKEAIKTSIEQKKALFSMGINELYDQGKFSECGEAYEMQVKLSQSVKEVDTLSIYNSAVCHEKANDLTKAAKQYEIAAKIGYKPLLTYTKASACYRKNGNISQAKSILAEGRKQFPNDRELLIELVNTNIDSGDAAGAEVALAEAISADPENKQLYYTIGTIYIDLKQPEKAEASLNKAIEIDPNYTEAQYQLGAHLFNWANELKYEAGQLDYKNPKVSQLESQSKEVLGRALIVLEKYIEKKPNEKVILNILAKAHHGLGNTEKAAEYKKRAEAIK